MGCCASRRLLVEIEYSMSNSSRRFQDAAAAASIDAPNMLHSIFKSRGPPCSFPQSFSPILASIQQYIHLGLNQKSLSTIQNLSLDFAQNLLLRVDGSSMTAEVKALVKALTIDEAAAVHAYTVENGPYTPLNKLLREESVDLLDPFVDYLWLLIHGLSKCPLPFVPLVYRGVRSGVGATYNVGVVITWCSFTSCTTQAEALENDTFLGESGERTEFHITLTTNRARSISHLSLMADEAEILLPPDTRLRVMGRADRGHGLWVVQLLEEPCLAPIIVAGRKCAFAGSICRLSGEYGTILDVQPRHRCSFIL